MLAHNPTESLYFARHKPTYSIVIGSISIFYFPTFNENDQVIWFYEMKHLRNAVACCKAGETTNSFSIFLERLTERDCVGWDRLVAIISSNTIQHLNCWITSQAYTHTLCNVISNAVCFSLAVYSSLVLSLQ